jgi:peroxiredoxin
MAVESVMLPLGTTAPTFNLPDTVSGKNIDLAEAQSDLATVVMFLCNHCPYVKHVNEGLVRLANEYQAKGVTFVAISSNDIEAYPDDSPQRMKEVAAEQGYPFPYLYDEDQSVARAYKAACTPDFYVFDKDMNLVYRGQMDSSRPNSGVPVTGEDLRAALDAVIAGEPVPADQRPSMGCSIKWKDS